MLIATCSLHFRVVMSHLTKHISVVPYFVLVTWKLLVFNKRQIVPMNIALEICCTTIGTLNHPWKATSSFSQIILLLQCFYLHGVECTIMHHVCDVFEEQHLCVCQEQAITDRSHQVISIIACCHSVKLCMLSTWAFRSYCNYNELLIRLTYVHK